MIRVKKCLINNEFITSEKVISIVEPVSGTLFGQIPNLPISEIDRAYKSASDAFSM
jgi:acyl-CoA reductase-like NAD-dependent aldehyde dehydrogenase